MNFLSNIRIRSKLLLIVLLSAAAIATVGLLAYLSGRDALSAAAENALTAVRESKSAQIEDYFERVRSQLVTLAESRTVTEAITDMRASFFAALVENPPDPATRELHMGLVEGFYRDDFLPALAANTSRLLQLEDYLPDIEETVYFQYHYIVDNPQPARAKEQFDAANDGTAYSKVHAVVHPILRSYRQRFGYTDIYLIDPAGTIMYSVRKGIDYATNLRDGAFRGTGLAAAFAGAVAATQPGQITFADFAPYDAVGGSPNSFLATPIFIDGVQGGVLAFQVPIEQINDTMTGGQNWQAEGLGETGEAYVLGSDLFMRSDARPNLEDNAAFVANLRKFGMNNDADQVERFGTAILFHRVPTPPTQAAAAGETGTVTYNHLQVPTLAAYAPLEIPDASWIIVAEIATSEAFASTNRLARLVSITGGGVLLVLILVTVWIGQAINRPISDATQRLREISSGQGDLTQGITVRSRDEIGELARYFNEFQSKLRQIVSAVQQGVARGTNIGESLSSSSSNTSTAISQISRHLADIRQQFETLDTGIAQSTDSATNLKDHIGNLSAQVEKQAEAVNQSSASVEQMSASINSLSAVAEERREKAEELAKLTQTGGEKVQETNRIIADVAETADKMLDTIAIINSIATETNLLSMNAAIEAAHAGDAGCGFAVVADEVRKLAESTSSNAKTISANLQGVVEKVQSALEVSTASGDTFRGISNEVRDVSLTFKELTTSLAELSGAGGEILRAIVSLTEVQEDVRTGSGEMEGNVAEMFTAIQANRQISANVLTGVGEVANGVDEIANSATNVAALGEENREALSQINGQVNSFSA
jgi:methyl-accepting chemotaxis protein